MKILKELDINWFTSSADRCERILKALQYKIIGVPIKLNFLLCSQKRHLLCILLFISALNAIMES